VGANGGQNIDITLKQFRWLWRASGLNITGTTVATEAGASAALTSIRHRFQSIGGTRADLGALQNRFNLLSKPKQIYLENVSAAFVRKIRWILIATETAEINP